MKVRSWQGSEQAPTEQAYLGNGVIGLRLGHNPLGQDGRCYLTGFQERELRDGVTQFAELPNPLAMNIHFAKKPAQLETHAQYLDYRQACLTTEMTATGQSGQSAKVTCRHLTYRNIPCLIGLKLSITAQQDGPLTVKLGCAPARGQYQLVQANASSPGSGGLAGEVKLEWRSSETETHAASITSFRVSEESAPPEVNACRGMTDQSSALVIHWSQLKIGQTVSLDFVCAMVSNAYHPVPGTQAARMILWGLNKIGPEELFEQHVKAWDEIWATRPVLTGDDETQEAIDGSMFYLHSSVHRSSLQSMAPFGLSSNQYYGHVFWDCETWTYPPILLQQPEAARSILEFRLNGLDQARCTASLFGYDGAMFPWEAMMGGAEDTPYWAGTGYMEHHIIPDIAFAFWQYQCATGDTEFLYEGTWPVLRDVARWIASRVEKTERGYEIRHVIGADEFSENINNSSHTNLACRSALNAAIACAGLMGRDYPKAWEEIAKHLVIPRGEDGMILQQDGWTPAHVSKQADTALAIYPLDEISDPVDIQKVIEGHVRIDPEATATVAMGDQINAVLCARNGQGELARRVWDRGWKPYWIDTWGMYAETVHRRPGCFITGCGGLLQAILMGFPGLQLNAPTIAKHPVSLPEGWESIVCDRIWLHGRPHRMEAQRGMKSAQITAVDEMV